jgi:hypothetical protein
MNYKKPVDDGDIANKMLSLNKLLWNKAMFIKISPCCFLDFLVECLPKSQLVSF